MNKKGFTLVELLAVIVILTMLGVFTVSIILDKMDSTNSEIDEATKTIITTAAENYYNKHKDNFATKAGNVYCIALNEVLESENITDLSAKTNANITDSSTFVKISFSSERVIYDVVNNCVSSTAEILPNKPLLLSNMIPITWDEHNNIIVADSVNSNTWYNYEEGRWANALIVPQKSLAKYKSLNVGELVIPFNEINDEVIFAVWIPRYKYEMITENGVFKSAKIIFEKGLMTTSSGVYNTHSAFKDDSQDLSGFWVTKYELTQLNSSASASGSLINSSYSQKTYANTYENLARAIDGLYNSTYSFLRSEADLSMISNKEWAAVAYLAHSKYGVNTEKVYPSDIYTGTILDYSLESISSKQRYEVKPLSYNVDNFANYTNEIYYNERSIFASTTRNMTGVYGMNGGASEWVVRETMNVNANDEALNVARGSYGSYSTDFDGTTSLCLTRGGDISTTSNGIFAFVSTICSGYNGTRLVIK